MFSLREVDDDKFIYRCHQVRLGIRNHDNRAGSHIQSVAPMPTKIRKPCYQRLPEGQLAK
jgi:hypothetical protein